MANYYATARTNYFAVKDADAFKAEVALMGLQLITKEKDEETTLYGFLGSNDDGGIPFSYWDKEIDDDIEIDWVGFFNRHLADSAVAIVIESGAEKHRYVMGYAVAYNNKGEFVQVNLDEIYDKAIPLSMGFEITRAEY